MGMSAIEMELDHVDIVVPDIDEVYVQLQRCGFTISAPSSRANPRTCAVAFPGIYLAFSDCENQSALSESTRSSMHISGARGILFRVSNMENAVTNVAAQGLKTLPFFEFGRPVQTASGVDEVRFRVAWILPPEGETYGNKLFGLIQHMRPDIIWNTQTERHDNDARGVFFVFSRVESLTLVQLSLSRLLGEPILSDGRDILCFNARTTKLCFALPSAFKTRFPSIKQSVDTVIGIRVNDRNIADHLEHAGVHASRIPEEIILPDCLPGVALKLSVSEAD